MTDLEHNHRGPDPCPVCDYDPQTPAGRLHPTEIRNGLEGIAKTRAAMKAWRSLKEPDE